MGKQQGPTVQHCNYIQYLMINCNRKECKKKIHICIAESLSCTAEINTTFKINYTLIKILEYAFIYLLNIS